MKKHIVASDYDFTKVKYEESDQVSVTVPDQAMSISEIIRRFASGLPMDDERVPFYEDEEDENFGEGIDLSRMDKVDIMMLQKDNEAYLKELREQLRNQTADRKKTQELIKQAEQGTTVQRTTGEEGDQDTDPAPAQNPISEKNPPAEGQKPKK